MLNIVGNDIYLTRGDTSYIEIDVSYAGYGCSKDYKFQEGDKLFFTVKQNFNMEDFLFQKVISFQDTDEIENGSVIIKIEPSDTNNLDFRSYIYDVELITSDGDKYTIVRPSLFEILPEVTYIENEG